MPSRTNSTTCSPAPHPPASTTTTVVITDDTVPVDSTPADTVPATVPVTEAVPIAEQNIPSFEEGDAIARLEIPRIGVDKIVVAGVEKPDLKKGPGHYPETPMPGQLGNSAIAGHRTTYGQPFYSIEQLQPGDDLIVTTPCRAASSTSSPASRSWRLTTTRWSPRPTRRWRP